MPKYSPITIIFNQNFLLSHFDMTSSLEVLMSLIFLFLIYLKMFRIKTFFSVKNLSVNWKLSYSQSFLNNILAVGLSEAYGIKVEMHVKK